MEEMGHERGRGFMRKIEIPHTSVVSTKKIKNI